MTRSPLAYPLNRSADIDGGGAADLQTDIMRFMAILSLCLVAIFALVQSIPLSPTETQAIPDVSVPAVQAVVEAPEEIPVAAETTVIEPVAKPAPLAPAALAAEPAVEQITLSRPQWVPEPRPTAAPVVPNLSSPATPAAANSEETVGFTLRFESDAALMRAVAAGKVGLYAIDADRAKRMTVSDSRISFWDASTPNAFHEMETQTVPASVVDALTRTGSVGREVSWGVTLPGKIKSQLDALMQSHSGGSLIIGASGDIYREGL